MLDFSALLRKSNNRVTQARIKIFKALENNNQPISVSDLIKECPEINRSSIYRTLDLFQQLGLINIVAMGFKKRYELAEPFRPHHHHLICQKCGKIIAIDHPELEKLIEQIARSSNFTNIEHHFEIYGYCQKCSN